MKKVSAIVTAGGQGKRMQADIPKQYLKIREDTPIIKLTVENLNSMDLVDEIIVVCTYGDIDFVKLILEKGNGNSFNKVTHIVEGGERRQDSVKKGVEKVKFDNDYVLIHDAVRPFFKHNCVEDLIKNAFEFKCAILGVKVKSTFKMSDTSGFVKETLDRNYIWEIQTPQVFKKDVLEQCYTKDINFDKYFYTDESMLVERYGYKVKLVEGNYDNIKITTPEDLWLGEKIYENRFGI